MTHKNLSSKIKYLRIKKGLSQQELADESGLSLRTIQRIENEETEPRGDSLNRLTKIFNIPPEEFSNGLVKNGIFLNVLLTLSALTFLKYQLLGIFIPLVIWLFIRKKYINSSQTAIRLINFQLSWILYFYAGLLLIFILNLFLAHFDTSSIVGQVFDMIKQKKIIITKENIDSGINILGSLFQTLGLVYLFLITMYAFNILSVLINSIRIISGHKTKYILKINFIPDKKA